MSQGLPRHTGNRLNKLAIDLHKQGTEAELKRGERERDSQ
jgi:hypothetical protein